MVTPRIHLAFIMISMMQRELDTFKDTIWNCHRSRSQKDAVLSAFTPDHSNRFPEDGLEQSGNVHKIIIIFIKCLEQEAGFLTSKRSFSVFLYLKLHPSPSWVSVVHLHIVLDLKPRHR